jgi:hypothetical protein
VSPPPRHAHEWYPISWFLEVTTRVGARASWSGEPALWACGTYLRCAAVRIHKLTPLQKAENAGLRHYDHTHRTDEAMRKCRKAA